MSTRLCPDHNEILIDGEECGLCKAELGARPATPAPESPAPALDPANLRPLREGEHSQIGDFVKISVYHGTRKEHVIVPCKESDCGEIFDNDVGYYFRPVAQQAPAEPFELIDGNESDEDKIARLDAMARGELGDLSDKDRAAIQFALACGPFRPHLAHPLDEHTIEARETLASLLYFYFPRDPLSDWKNSKGIDKVKHRECASAILDRYLKPPAPDCNRCGDTGSIGHSQGFDGEAYEIDCPECHPDAPEVGTGSETSPDAGASIREALELAIKEFAHDVPGSCWSTGPLTGTAEDDMCRGCMVIRAANSALSLLAKPAEASDAEQIPHPVAEAEHSSPSQPPELLDGARLVAACETMLEEFENWNNPMMALEPKDVKWMRFYASMQATRAALPQDPTRTGKGE